MATGYEVSAYRNLDRIARALERIADAQEKLLERTVEQDEAVMQADG